MNLNSKRTIVHGLILLILSLDMAIPKAVSASNNLFDMAVEDNGDVLRVILQLSDVPKYRIGQAQINQVVLTLFDTIKASQIEDAVVGKITLSIIDQPESSDLSLGIHTGRPVIEINSSWSGPGKSLILDILQGDEDLTEDPTPFKDASLGDIRFGFQNKATRMVMRLDQQPSWTMTYHDPYIIDIRLKAHSEKLKGKRYGPMNRIQEVIVVKRDNQDMNIGLRSETSLSRMKIFWMPPGNRLVMDLFDDPLVVTKKEPETVSLAEKQDAHDVLQNITTKDGNEQNGVSFNGITTADTGPKIRMKIPPQQIHGAERASQIDSGEYGTAHHLLAKPKLNNNLPLIPIDEKFIEDLSPGAAFLFGRIREARELDDFQKGLSLIDQFITEFPESPLIEEVVYWRGDFYYLLWGKSGDQTVGEKVIQNYQFAVTHFGQSKYAPMTYIKMAQVSSQMGDHLSAIGYLSVVTGDKKNENYFPLAYLTRGKIYLKMDQPERAVQDFETLLNQFPRSPIIAEANFWIANYYHAIGQYEKAAERLAELEDSNALLYLEYPEHLLMSAKNYLYLEKYDIARDYLFKALNLGHQPETPDLLLSRIGDTYYHQAQKDVAGKFYRMVMDYYPGTEGASISKIRMADYFSDITMLDDLSDKDGDEPLSELALLEKAYQLYERKQYREVMVSLKELILKSIPTETRRDAKQLYMKATEKEMERLFHEHLFGELIDLYEKNKGTWPEVINPEVMLLLALAFQSVNQNDQAIKIFKAIKLYDLDQTAKGQYIMGLAKSHLAENKLKDAQQVLLMYKDEALNEIDEQRAILLLADISLEAGRYSEAEKLYQSLIRNNPRLPNLELAKVYYAIGKTSMLSKQYAQAEEAFKLAIKLGEKEAIGQAFFSTSYIGLGNLYHQEGRYHEAVMVFEKGFDLGYGPDQEDYWENRFRLAVSYMNSGNNEKAVSALNEISAEGDPVLQQMAQIRLGSIDLERYLKYLSIQSGR
ncbi:MAG: tetratricopeptide repeat protein [Deltaproteobacteria bacterium]|nr:tetratricopeptide repeat protein [Deltaproteobacteria bacterium]